jgi:hypothetical protein
VRALLAELRERERGGAPDPAAEPRFDAARAAIRAERRARGLPGI